MPWSDVFTSLPSWISVGQGAVTFARRHRRQLVFLAAAGAAAYAALSYLQREEERVAATLSAERSAQGTRSLRSRFAGSGNTVSSTLRAVLRPGKDRIAACPFANSDALVLRLRTPNLDRDAKRATWEELKIAAVVRLVASLYFLVTLYTLLLAQINLVARYSAVDADAPVETLPGGALTVDNKQRFLSLMRVRLFDGQGVEDMVKVVKEAVDDVLGPLPLTKKVSRSNTRQLLRDVCEAVQARACRAKDGSEAASKAGFESSAVFSPGWLLLGDPTLNLSASVHQDANTTQLVLETLDICEVLGYECLVQQCVIALADQACDMLEPSLWKVDNQNMPDATSEPSEGQAALAPVLAQIANVSQSALSTGVHAQDVNSTDVENYLFGQTAIAGADPGDSPFVRTILQSPECEAFAAAVFLSGERQAVQGDPSIPGTYHQIRMP